MEEPAVHRIEDELGERWLQQWLEQGLAGLEAYLAKHAAFIVSSRPTRPERFPAPAVGLPDHGGWFGGAIVNRGTRAPAGRRATRARGGAGASSRETGS
jgi:hypothetical protein